MTVMTGLVSDPCQSLAPDPLPVSSSRAGQAQEWQLAEVGEEGFISHQL
jgi:phage baseplate assembly protein gpV